MMDLVQRAKIFSSFDSLKGYKDLLREVEKEPVQPRILAEDDIEELNRRIYEVQKEMMIRVEYWNCNKVVVMTGVVSGINIDLNELQVVKTKINLKKIIWIDFVEEDC